MTVVVVVAVVVAVTVALALLPFIYRWKTSRGAAAATARAEPPAAPPAAPSTVPPPSAQPPAQPAAAQQTTPQPASAAPPDAEAPEPAVPEPEVPEPAVAPPRSLRTGLSRARSALADRLGSLVRRGVDDATFTELEEALLLADVGVETTQQLLIQLRDAAADNRLTEPTELVECLRTEMLDLLAGDRALQTAAPDSERTAVWLFVGVNGVGKTTSIGKVAHRLSNDGTSVLLCAADTFRAAAASQLNLWADRVGAPIVSGASGADPSAVVFDSVQSAAARGAQLVLADTAGRLQNKANLMNELAKVRRVADREPGQVAEVLLVIDATTGQNGLAQAQAFAEATDVTGVVLTKLDGSAKGGIVFAVEAQLGIPVKLVGVGEGIDDLVDFDPDEFVEGLLPEG